MKNKKQYKQPKAMIANITTPLLTEGSISLGGPIGGGNHTIPSDAKESSPQWDADEE